MSMGKKNMLEVKTCTLIGILFKLSYQIIQEYINNCYALEVNLDLDLPEHVGHGSAWARIPASVLILELSSEPCVTHSCIKLHGDTCYVFISEQQWKLDVRPLIVLCV